MKFSLILATLGEGSGIPRFLQSLRGQGGVECELVVVDQNGDDHVSEMIRHAAPDMPVRHVRASPGLSAARNVGLGLARGDIVAFPDDDCWYPAGLLAAVARRLREPALDGLTCRCADADGRLAAGGEDRRSGDVTRRNVWNRGVSATMFLKRATTEPVGAFDGMLGLGAPTAFQSGEETDYLLRCLAQGLSIWYQADLTVHHPVPLQARRRGAVAKARSYGMGMGRVLRTHGYGRLDVARHVAMPLAGAFWAMLRGDVALAQVRAARALGRFHGWRWRPTAGVDATFLRTPGQRTPKTEATPAPSSCVRAVHGSVEA